MPLVIDASVTLAWVLADEDEAVAELALERVRDEGAFVPTLWWYEIRNALIIAERKRRVAPDGSTNFLKQLAILAITPSLTLRDDDVFSLARLNRLTFYDASYLALAQNLNLPLATLDSELMRAARREKIPLLTA